VCERWHEGMPVDQVLPSRCSRVAGLATSAPLFHFW